jgi:effector-binding domain-containing protein
MTTARYQIEIREVPEEQVLQISEHVPQSDLSTVIPADIAEVHGYLEELGLGFEGAPFCACSAPGEDGLMDVEVGWPVAGAVSGRGRIEAATLPAARALVMMHVGPFDALPEAYNLLARVLHESGLTPTGKPREVYLSNPEEVTDPNDYETLILWPIGPEGELVPGEPFHREVDSAH